MQLLAIAGLIVLLVVVTFIAFRARREADQIRAKYDPALSVYETVERARADFTNVRKEHEAFVSGHQKQRAELEAKYTAALAQYEALKKEIALLEENVEDISFGLYRPHFNLKSSEQYKIRLEEMRSHQKKLVREGLAARSEMNWQVGGNAQEGARMTKQYLKILLRAFNAESDAAVAIVSWNNISKMEERIRKSCEAVNALGEVMKMSITPTYRDAKLAELQLAYEYEQKRYEEKEEQRRIREQIREEEKVQRELEKARQEAESEEARYEEALERAREEATKATGEKLAALTARIQDLANQLEEAHQLKQRAISQAQLTKSGHVYVVSNIGTFGDRVFKVGMTRRLEPMERIAELGDASVPFPFDVHAMIYSEEARDLECELHSFFSDQRVNLVNPRKEFFNVTLDELEGFARQKGVTVEFTKLVEAKEYRETVSLREQRQRASQPARAVSSFPQQLFDEQATIGAM